MFRFRSKKTAQRKYIDLIKEATSKWPNWDPPKHIYAGDFGTIDKKTGELMVEGNIYSHDDTKQIASKYPAVPEAETNQFAIHSYEVRGMDLNASAGANVPTVQGLVFNGQWQFNTSRGAILLMHEPQLTRVPDQFFNPETLRLPVFQGKGKVVVDQVWVCHGYYMYLSSRSSERVAVNLKMNVINPAAPPVNLNLDTGLSWSFEGCTGIRQYAYKEDKIYTPLFCLKQMRKGQWRREKKDERDEDAWFEADVPWKNLDDEGVTEPEGDNGLDDEDDDD